MLPVSNPSSVREADLKYGTPKHPLNAEEGLMDPSSYFSREREYLGAFGGSKSDKNQFVTLEVQPKTPLKQFLL